MNKTISLGLALAVLAGCGGSDDKRVAFDGQFFRTKVANVEKQRDEFVTTVQGVSKSFEGARGAALHASNAYCVSTYGSSEIAWVVGPDTPPSQLRIVDDTLTYRGTCPQAQ